MEPENVPKPLPPPSPPSPPSPAPPASIGGARTILLRANLLVCTVCLCIAQSMTLSALLSTAWIEFTVDGAKQTVDKPTRTLALLVVALLLGLLALVAMLLRFFKRHPRRTIVAALAFDVLNAVFLVVTAATATHLAAGSVPPEGEGARAGFGAVSLVIAVPLAFLSSIMLVVDRVFGKSNEFVPERERRLSLAITLISLYLAVGSYVFVKLEGWAYEESVVFCVATIATIGYGNIVPSTTLSRLFCMVYAVLGVLLVGYTIDTLRRAIVQIIIDSLDTFRHHWGLHGDAGAKRMASRHSTLRSVKVTVIVFFVIVLWAGGAALFSWTEGWSYFDAFWFCFVTLTTIGYGDYYPTTRASEFLFPFYTFLTLGVFAFILSTIGDETRKSLEDRFLHGSRKRRQTSDDASPHMQTENELGHEASEPLLARLDADEIENGQLMLETLMRKARAVADVSGYGATSSGAVTDGDAMHVAADDEEMKRYLLLCKGLLAHHRRYEERSYA